MADDIEIPFNFPQIPDNVSEQMRQFLVELRRMITDHFVADGGPKEFVSITLIDGDLIFTGTAGLLYGNMDQDGGTFAVSLANKDQLYELDAAVTHITAGPLNGVTFPDDHLLKVSIAGDWFVVYSLVAQIDALTSGSEHVEFEILKNGTAMSKGETHVDFKNTVREFPLGSTTIITLAAGDEVSIGVVAVDSSGKTITIDHLEVSMVMIGGPS